MDAPAQNEISLFQAKLQAQANLTALVKNYQAYQTHLDVLNSSPIEDETKENVFEDYPPVKIVLHFGTSRGEQYEIKNSALLADVRNYMTDRINVRMAEVQAQIMQTAL